MSTEDRTITCVDCNQSFTWTASEQDFFADKGYSEPKRCKACRQAKKERSSEMNKDRAVKRMRHG